MMRREFTCLRCGALLAVVRPADILRVQAGVAVTHNWRFGTLRLRCPCGHLQGEDVPRKVTTLVVEPGREAA